MKKIFLFSLLGLLVTYPLGHAFAQTDNKEEAKLILESFCQEFYSSCFSGRTYLEHSLTVTKVERSSLNGIKVYGFHSYKGRFGTMYRNMEYYAYITVRNGGGTKIEFHKMAKADLLHPEDYWEECSKTIY
jgi:hypothetical protein